MQYTRTWTPKPGLSEIVKPGDAGLQQIRFGMLYLAAGESFTADAEDKETALIVLSGTCAVRGDGFDFNDLGQRKDVFSGKPATVYLPAGNGYTVEAATDVEVALCRAASDRTGTPQLIGPDEVDMEEIYYFRFDRPGGFGIQKIHTDDRSIDETYTVQDHHTVLIPEGYHPVATAPGYSMYYLWVMAGENRRFLSRPDPDHAWVAQG